MDGYSYLTFNQRREIEALYGAGVRVVEIAARTERSVAAIYEENGIRRRLQNNGIGTIWRQKAVRSKSGMIGSLQNSLNGRSLMKGIPPPPSLAR